MTEKREWVAEDPYVIRVPDPERGGVPADLDLLPSTGFLGGTTVSNDPVERAIRTKKGDRFTAVFFAGFGAAFGAVLTAMNADLFGIGWLTYASGSVGLGLAALGVVVYVRAGREIEQIRRVPSRLARITVHPDAVDPLDGTLAYFVSVYRQVTKAGGRFTDYEVQCLHETLLAAGRVAELRAVLDAVTDTEGVDAGEHEDRRIELKHGEKAAIARLRDGIADLSSYLAVLTRSTKVSSELPAFTDFSDLAERYTRSRNALARARELGVRVTADAELDALARSAGPKEISR